MIVSGAAASAGDGDGDDMIAGVEVGVAGDHIETAARCLDGRVVGGAAIAPVDDGGEIAGDRCGVGIGEVGNGRVVERSAFGRADLLAGDSDGGVGDVSGGVRGGDAAAGPGDGG